MTTLLNVADQALIVDIIIAASNNAPTGSIARDYLELIEKVKSLEVEHIEVCDADFDEIFKEVDALDDIPAEEKKYCYDYFDVKKIVEEAGYTIQDKLENGYIWYDYFVKGVRHIWLYREGFQTADLIDGKYCNHKPCKTFAQALEREL